MSRNAIASLLIATAAMAVAVPARAEWLKATSRHFIVYSDTSADALRRQSAELERFDAAMRHFFRMGSDADAEANRVTVYVVPDRAAVEDMVGRENVAGFYIPRVTGSIAFTPRRVDGRGTLDPDAVLFHEYAHHFLFGGGTTAYPAWFVEGFAEFASTAMERDGGVWLGAAANHRARGLLTGKPLSLRQLLAPPAALTRAQRDALYGRGWLFTHFLMFDPVRREQFGRYVELFNEGRPSVEAATASFGDLDVLERDLDRYLQRRSIPAVKIALEQLPVATIDVRPLTPGERALIGSRMASTRGVNTRTAPALFARARAAAVPFAGDAVAQGWLAEIAFDARDHDAAEAAADAALAVAPTSSQALLYKARVLLARARRDKADAASWRTARSWIVKANRADTNDAGALALYYQSFGMEGAAPTRAAVTGLYRAHDLAPQDRAVAFSAARHYLLDGDAARAKRLLRTLASDPHARADNPAAKLLAQIDAGQAGADALGAAAKGAEEDGKAE